MKEQRKQTNNKRMFLYVLFLWTVSFLLHSGLNFMMINGPKVTIDEGLYTNIARSLAWDGELAFRGQPINYPYLFYSILLVPVYWINYLLKGDIYRYVQVFNTVLITSSSVPAFLFARDFIKDEKKAYLAAALVALMPDMVMGGYEMTECLLWPLALWLFFFGYRFFTRNRYFDGCMTALMTGLMFFSKPGAIVMGTVLLLACLIRSLRKKERSIKPAIVSLAVVLMLITAIYGLYLALFRNPSSLIGLYSKQTSEWTNKDILVAAEATVLLCFLFAFACGGLFCVLPLVHLNQFSEDQKGFIKASTVGVIAVIIGVAVFVVPYKWNGSLGKLPLHMRYCSMFIPTYYIYAMAIDVLHKKMNRSLLPALAVFIALSLFPGARAGFVYGESGSVDSFALSAFTTTSRLNGTAMGWCITLLLIVFILYFMLNIHFGWGRKMQKISTICFALFLLANTVCAYVNSNVYIDPTISADAQEVDEKIGHHKSLGITQRYYDDIRSYWLEGHLNGPMQQVTIDQMFVTMQDTNGVYVPFVPQEQAPNVNNHITPDTDTLVLGMTIAEQLELSDTVKSVKTSNGHFTIVTLQPGQRWVDSMFYGLDNNTLHAGAEGYLQVFDMERNREGAFILHFTASGKGSLNIQGQRVKLSEEKKNYSMTVAFEPLVSILAEDEDARIFSYTTEKGR